MPQTLHSCKLALDPQLHDDFFTIFVIIIIVIVINLIHRHNLFLWSCHFNIVICHVWPKRSNRKGWLAENSRHTKTFFLYKEHKKKHENRQINLLDENIKRKIHSTRVVVCASLANNLYTARLLFTICHSKGLDLSFSFVAASILLSIWETKSVCSADHHFAQKEEQGGSPQSHPSTQIWINSGQNVVSRYVCAYAILIPLEIIKNNQEFSRIISNYL